MMMKVNKLIARKVYNRGDVVELLPCKCRYENNWVFPVAVSKATCNSCDFDILINSVESCYCKELGLYCSYYIAES